MSILKSEVEKANDVLSRMNVILGTLATIDTRVSQGIEDGAIRGAEEAARISEEKMASIYDDFAAKLELNIETLVERVSEVTNAGVGALSTCAADAQEMLSESGRSLEEALQLSVRNAEEAFRVAADASSATMDQKIAEFGSLLESHVEAVSGQVATLLNSVSLSYLSWVAEALKAANAKLDASLYARDLNASIEDLRSVIDEVANARQLIQTVELLSSDLRKLSEVHSLIIPHLEHLSVVANTRFDLSAVEGAERATRAALNLKELLGVEKGMDRKW